MASRVAKNLMRTLPSTTSKTRARVLKTRTKAREVRAKGTGFTLVELLAVIVIVGIMVSTVVISYSGGDRVRRLQADAQRIAGLLELTRSEAIRRSQEWGVFVDESALSFASFDPQNREWVDYDERPLQETTLENIRFELYLDNQLELPKRFEEGNVPDLVFFSSGEAMKFDLRLQPDWETPAWTVSSDGLSRAEASRDEGRR